MVSDKGKCCSRRSVKSIPGRSSGTDSGRQKAGGSCRKPVIYRPQYVCLFTAAGLLEYGYGDASNDTFVNDMAGGFDPNYYYDSDPAYDITEDYCVSWPVYPSFKNTIEVLKKQSVEPGSYMAAENIQSIRIDLQNLYTDEKV